MVPDWWHEHARHTKAVAEMARIVFFRDLKRMAARRTTPKKAGMDLRFTPASICREVDI